MSLQWERSRQLSITLIIEGLAVPNRPLELTWLSLSFAGFEAACHLSGAREVTAQAAKKFE